MALTDKLTAIADAIREKTGSSDTMTLDEMATAVGNITGEGETTTVTTDSVDALVARTLTEYSSDTLTSVGKYAFRGCTGLTKVWIPSTCTAIDAETLARAPFYSSSSTCEIYTDVEDEDSIPEGWGTYWNYYSSSSTLTVHYGATHDEYEAA